jgi:flagellar basal body-associated protein FliL
MAELNVEPKKSSPWIWIVVVIIVIVIILFFVFRNNGNKTDNMHNGKDTTISQIIPSLDQRYLGNSQQTHLIAFTKAERNLESRQS